MLEGRSSKICEKSAKNEHPKSQILEGKGSKTGGKKCKKGQPRSQITIGMGSKRRKGQLRGKGGPGGAIFEPEIVGF